jgi:RNA polymerase sigma factor for flagellar operon FliA
VDHQRLLLDHLDLIDQIVRKTGRHRHLSAAEREDFAGFVHVRLIEDDYAVLRKFQGRSSWFTYLTAVIERMGFDFCAEMWGRWRPSAMAERLGPEAVLLERLVTRDSHTIEEAIALVRHHDVELTDDELRRIWAQLPARIRATEVGEDAAAALSGNDSSETLVEDADRERAVERLNRGLSAAFAQISPQDRVTIALHFDHKLSIARIAELTGSSVPTLHRRLKKSLTQIEAALRRDGFDARHVSDLIGHHSIALSPLLRAEVERFFKRVSLFKRDG